MSTPGIAVPGSNVPAGALVTPSGPQGIQGVKGTAGPTQVSADAGNIAQLGSDNLILVPQSQIWSVRLRSFNAVGNPNFEVDQRNCGTAVGAGGTVPSQDRWQMFKNAAATLQATSQQTSANVPVPGTNFYITSKFLRINLTAQQATLAAGDFLQIEHWIEGPMLRELLGDVTSLQVLVRSSVAGLKFGIGLRDNVAAYSLVNLATIPTANAWTLFPFPNLPLWTAGGTFPVAPGGVGYMLSFCLAAGSTLTAPSNGVWNAGNLIGAIGQSNFAASPVSSTFDIAFVQHEPGPQCSSLIDKPFSQNLDECLRYYQKTYDYAVKPGTGTGSGAIAFISNATATQAIPIRFPKLMAKAPSMYTWGGDGTPNAVYIGSTAYGITAHLNVAQSGFGGWNITTVAPSLNFAQAQYTADTGW